MGDKAAKNGGHKMSTLNEESKTTINEIIAKVKATKAAKIEETYAKIRSTKVIPQQNEIDKAKVTLIAAYGAEHNKTLESLKQNYEASVEAENKAYQANITKANNDALENKKEVETNARQDVTDEVSASYDEIIQANEKLLA
jgi:hypothetical protein